MSNQVLEEVYVYCALSLRRVYTRTLHVNGLNFEQTPLCNEFNIIQVQRLTTVPILVDRISFVIDNNRSLHGCGPISRTTAMTHSAVLLCTLIERDEKRISIVNARTTTAFVVSCKFCWAVHVTRRILGTVQRILLRYHNIRIIRENPFPSSVPCQFTAVSLDVVFFQFKSIILAVRVEACCFLFFVQNATVCSATSPRLHGL